MRAKNPTKYKKKKKPQLTALVRQEPLEKIGQRQVKMMELVPQGITHQEVILLAQLLLQV